MLQILHIIFKYYESYITLQSSQVESCQVHKKCEVIWPLKTLFNIVEAWFKNGWTLMSGLYNDVQMDQWTARNSTVL